MCIRDSKVFVMTLQFTKLMRLYRMFRSAVRNGDAIAIEWLYTKFLPIWLALGKNHYFEIGLSMIEQFYHDIPFDILHMTRSNQTVPLYDGVNKTGEPMANWALDAIIELLQKYYHGMQLPNEILSWRKHSGNAVSYTHLTLPTICSV